MSIEDEKFELMMCDLEDNGSWHAKFLRARDTDQREALKSKGAALEWAVGETNRLTEALARVEAERDKLADRLAVRIGERNTAQAHLAEAVGLLRKVRMCGVLGESGPDVDSEIGQFLARQAQAEQQEAREPVLARPEHGVSLDEALALTMDRYSGAIEKLAASEQQEANGTHDLDAVAEAIFNADKDNWYSVGPYPQLHANDKARLRAMARAALATQPAAGEPVAFDGKTVADRLDQMADAQPSGSSAQSDLYAAATVWRKHLAPPAAAHGDEAVRKPSWKDEHEAFKSWARSRITPLKLDLDEVGLFYDEVAGVAHDAWHARAAMRAQGDGGAA